MVIWCKFAGIVAERCCGQTDSGS